MTPNQLSKRERDKALLLKAQQAFLARKGFTQAQAATLPGATKRHLNQQWSVSQELFDANNAMARTDDLPCAEPGFISYRYAGPYGAIMIGASNTEEALREANRSLRTPTATLDKLQIWNGTEYAPCQQEGGQQ